MSDLYEGSVMGVTRQRGVPRTWRGPLFGTEYVGTQGPFIVSELLMTNLLICKLVTVLRDQP